MIARLLLATAGLLACAAPASAGTDFSSIVVNVTPLGGGIYNFTQTGFADGASVNGTFTGIDNDANLQISSFDGEVTDGSMSFTGNSLVAGFSLGFADLVGLVFDLDGNNTIGDGALGAIEGIAFGPYFIPGVFGWAAGQGPFALCDGVQDCGIVQDDTLVPAPAPLALFGLGAAVLGVAGIRRR